MVFHTVKPGSTAKVLHKPEDFPTNITQLGVYAPVGSNPKAFQEKNKRRDDDEQQNGGRG